MAAGATTKLWSLTDMVRVIEDCEGHGATKFSNRLAAEKKHALSESRQVP
jgi:hypothetical protein